MTLLIVQFVKQIHFKLKQTYNGVQTKTKLFRIKSISKRNFKYETLHALKIISNFQICIVKLHI